jgi:hypothetical protein
MINNKEEIPLEIYRERYRALDTAETAARCGVHFNSEAGVFTGTMLGFKLNAAWPEFSLTPEDKERCPKALRGAPAQILVMRFLIEGVRTQDTGRFLTYRELPWGDVYDRNFQGRCIKRLAFGFGSRISAFEKASERLGGLRLDRGDASYELTYFEHLKVQLYLWSGDDEFPPNSQFLFSDNTPSAFSAEDMAVFGDVIIGALKELSA